MSSVLIKGMKKPTACYKCKLRTGKYCGILTENEKCADDGVLPHCPIVEIPETHRRLIETPEIEWEAVGGDEKEISLGALIALAHNVDNAPTIIDEERHD